MPIVPKYESGVQQTMSPGVRRSADAPIEAFGGGVSRVTDAIGGLSDTVNKIALNEQKKADDTVFLDNDLKVSQLQTTLEVNAKKMQGADAFGAVDYVKSEWEKGVAEITKDLSSSQKARLSGAINSRYENLYKTASLHTASEGERFADETTLAHAESSRSEAAQNPTDQNRIDQAIEKQVAVLEPMLQRKGLLGTAKGDQIIQESLSKTHVAVMTKLLDNGMTKQAQDYLDRVTEKKIPGLVAPGNIDLKNRPIVNNDDGTISTVRSIGVNIDGKEVLLPTVSDDGKNLSKKEAVDLYKNTGKHLGIFDSVPASNNYAQKLHRDQEAQASGRSKLPPLTDGDMDRIESKLKSNQLLDDGLRTWQEFKDLRLSDGSPDEAKAEAKIMARTDIATEQKLKLVQAYKGFAAEDVKNRAAQDAARDRTFLNGIVKAKSEGVPMSEVLRQASGYSKDPYQQSLREETIKKLYAPPTESDHAVHNKLWTEVQEGRGSIAAIDAAYGQGKLSPQNWESLRQGQYKVTANGSDPEHKAAWDRIGILADEKYGSDKKSKEQFLFVMHQKSGKLSAPELINLATDQLKKDPSTGWFSFTQDRKWGAELQKVDASNSAFGKLYEDVGQDEITAIGRGALFSGKKSWGPADVDSFANAFGGYNAIKKGTPVNNAIQSIVRRNGLVTVKNINAVLKAHPDGNY